MPGFSDIPKLLFSIPKMLNLKHNCKKKVRICDFGPQNLLNSYRHWNFSKKFLLFLQIFKTFQDTLNLQILCHKVDDVVNFSNHPILRDVSKN